MPHQAGSDPGRSGPSWGGLGGNSQSSQCLVTSSQQAVENWQLEGEGRWPVATEEGSPALLSLPGGSMAADGCLELSCRWLLVR